MQRARDLWGANVPVLEGARILRNVVTLGLLAAGVDCALADKLDKTACKQLKNELSYVLAAGAREDMAQGPDWAKANLTRERLQKIKKLIELEEQLEFRCNVKRSRVVAVKPKQRPLIPEPPQRKPAFGDDTTHATTAAPPSTAAVPSASPAKVEPMAKSAARTPGKIAKDEAALVKERAKLVDDDVKKDAKKVRGATNSASAPVKKAAAPTPPAATKPAPSSRPATKNAYVSPSEVNPFFVTRYGTPR